MSEDYTVSLVRGIDVDRTVKNAISLIGGMKTMIKGGDRILVKPNFTVAATPQIGLTTDTRILETIINLALDAGAGDITIGEGSACNNLSEINGLPEVLRRTGAKAADLNKIPDTDLVTVKVPGPLMVKEITIPRLVLDSDVLINVPKLKVGGFVTSLGMKNVIGVLKGKGSWSTPRTPKPPFKPKGEKKRIHSFGNSRSSEFRKVVVDLNTVVQSDLVVVDGLYGLEGGGEQEGSPVPMDLIIAGKNIVSVDATASAIMGFDPSRIEYIKYAEQKGLGIGQLDKIQVKGLRLEDATKMFKPALEEHARLQFGS